jgi:hypothetical protein
MGQLHDGLYDIRAAASGAQLTDEGAVDLGERRTRASVDNSATSSQFQSRLFRAEVLKDRIDVVVDQKNRVNSLIGPKLDLLL